MLGGKREGAGRKKGGVNSATLALKDRSAMILHRANAPALWEKLLKSEDMRLVQDTLKYLTDRVYGKPAQAVTLSGGTEPIKVIHEFIGR